MARGLTSLQETAIEYKAIRDNPTFQPLGIHLVNTSICDGEFKPGAYLTFGFYFKQTLIQSKFQDETMEGTGRSL